MTTTTDETRNATLEDLAKLLRDQQGDKCDAVVPATAIRSVGGILHVQGMSMEAQAGLGDDIPGTFRPTALMDSQIADKLGIPAAYLRRMRDSRPDLLDQNINGWLHGTPDTIPDGPDGRVHFVPGSGPDHRKFLIRTFTATDGPGIGRALLSDSYAPFDYLDCLTGTLSAIRETGKAVEVVGCDLSERRMVIRVACPDIAVLAPKLLGGYRSPVDGYPGIDLDRLARGHAAQHLGWDRSKGETPPVLFAGFEVTTSETGGGATTITPRLVAAACKNGLKVTVDIMRRVHLGSKLEAGEVKWSNETYRRNVDLITSMTKDAVLTCLSEEYLAKVVERIEAKADTPVSKPDDTIKLVGKRLAFTEAQTDAVLSDFIKGGQMTAGGVLNAITSAAQSFGVEDALAMENGALEAFDMVAALR